jgi:hypothetical protein
MDNDRLRDIAFETERLYNGNKERFTQYADSFHSQRSHFQKTICNTNFKTGKPVPGLLELDPLRVLTLHKPLKDEKEQLWQAYIWLIIIHDSLLKPNLRIPIDNSKVEPLKDFFWIIEKIKSDLYTEHPVFKRDNVCGLPIIEDALNKVTSDLTKQAVDNGCKNHLRSGKIVGQDDSGKKPPKKQQISENRQFLTLKQFIELYCDLTSKPDIQSKADLLHTYNRKKKIELPKPVHKYKKGQHKFYYVDDLKNKWPIYQGKMPTLPPLKLPEK